MLDLHATHKQAFGYTFFRLLRVAINPGSWAGGNLRPLLAFAVWMLAADTSVAFSTSTRALDERFRNVVRIERECLRPDFAQVVDLRLYPIIDPPQETLEYDGAGRLIGDAFWNYTWDGAGRLTQAERKKSCLSEPGAKSEVVTCIYDADGRRTQKTHTITYVGDTGRTETSKVLWSGWLPLLEIRSGYNAFHALDPRNLFPVSKSTHDILHLQTTIGPVNRPLDIYFQPINPLHRLELDFSYPLAR